MRLLSHLLLFGGASFLLQLLVGLLFPSLLLGGAPWPPSLGVVAFYTLLLRGAAFSPSSVWLPLGLLRWLVMRCSLSFFVVLPSFPFFFGWGCFLSLFCWKVLPYLLFLRVVFWVGPLFPSLLLGGAAWPPSLGGVASGPLSFCVVLPSFSPFWWCCFLSPLLLGGAVHLLSPFRWGCFPSLFCWLVLPSFSSFGWGCFPPPLLLGGVAWPPSLGGVALFPLFFAWCCLPSPPSLGGSLSKRKIKKMKKTKLKTKNRNKEKQRGKQKEETKKKEKF